MEIQFIIHFVKKNSIKTIKGSTTFNKLKKTIILKTIEELSVNYQIFRYHSLNKIAEYYCKINQINFDKFPFYSFYLDSDGVWEEFDYDEEEFFKVSDEIFVGG